MQLSRRSHREWRIILWVSLVSAIASAFFGIRVAPANEWWLRSAMHGAVTSLVIATPILLLQMKGDRLAFMRRLRRRPLAVYFAFKVMFYFVVIVGGLVISRLPLSDDFPTYINFSPLFRQSLVFSIVMAVVGNLFFEVGGLLGMGTLRNLVTGRYVHPRREQRAFLLIDMKDSTGVAERLGPIRFHELLNDFFRDIADAALECEAEIYKYVGDEVILTWSAADVLGNGDCLACPFIARDNIEANRPRYLTRFGDVPAFRAASHFGEIVTGEIGEVRREIAYVGDTLNTAARLLEAAKELSRDVLVSTDLLEHVALPAELKAEQLPTLVVRGRARPLGVAALERAGGSSPTDPEDEKARSRASA
jgi:adenylate cyclase